MTKKQLPAIQKELMEKGLSDDGVVGVGTVYKVPWYGYLLGMLGMLVTQETKGELLFMVRGDMLIVVRYYLGKILYNEAFGIKKEHITKFKVGAIYLKFQTTDKKKYKFLMKRIDNQKPFNKIQERLGF